MENKNKGISTKKLVIGLCVIGFLSLVGIVQVIRVVGGNILESINGKTTVEANGDITSLSDSDAKKIVDDAEKELKAKEEQDKNLQDSEKKIFEAKVAAQKAQESKQTKLPLSSIIVDNNFDYHNTKGIVLLNGNYYVGYYCGLKEVWNAADKAQDNAITLHVMLEKGISKNSEDYQTVSARVKGLTPYIKEIQDMDMKTADPNKMIDIINKYMQDTARMNCREVDRQFYFGLVNEIFGTNENFRIAINPNGLAEDCKISDSMKYLINLDTNKYPPLNKVQ